MQFHNFVLLVSKHTGNLHGNIVIQEEAHLSSHGLGHLPGNKRIDLASMIFIVRKTLINLRALEVGEAANNIVDGAAVDEKAHDIVYADPSAFHNRVTPSHPWNAS
jgi:hypothetical protein